METGSGNLTAFLMHFGHGDYRAMRGEGTKSTDAGYVGIIPWYEGGTAFSAIGRAYNTEEMLAHGTVHITNLLAAEDPELWKQLVVYVTSNGISARHREAEDYSFDLARGGINIAVENDVRPQLFLATASFGIRTEPWLKGFRPDMRSLLEGEKKRIAHLFAKMRLASVGIDPNTQRDWKVQC